MNDATETLAISKTTLAEIASGNRHPNLVAFVGPAGVGKSTAGAALHALGFVRHRFAEPIKAMLRALGLTVEQVDGSLKETPCRLLGGETPRYAMQTLGTEWGRHTISQTLWVDAWAATLPESPVYVDDCRFPNEVELIKSMGGIVIRIASPGWTHASDHASEAHELPSDIVIESERGDIRGMQRAVLRAVIG
jgi:hypothetical protein